jgi:hypothetical protein
LIDRVLTAWDETRVDQWLHAPAIPDELPLRDQMNHRVPEDLHGDVRDLDQLVLMMKKMMGDLSLDDLNLVGSMGVQLKKDDRKKRDGWMDGQNWRVVFSHPFRSPLFRF